MNSQTDGENFRYESNKFVLSSIKNYESEWNYIRSFTKDGLEELRNIAVKGDLKISNFRSICWSLLLNCFDQTSTELWVARKQETRMNYKILKNKYCLNPHSIKEDVNDNPLSQSEQSVWNQHFCDQELTDLIKQDVVRTFPGVDFFRKTFIQGIMTNILFCYARQHPNLCYRQGMHEILAPIIFVIHSDQQAFAHICEISEEIDPVLANVLSINYLEEDSYVLFDRIMEHIEPFYRIKDSIPSSAGYFPLQQENYSYSEMELIEQLNMIKDKILLKEDLHLHNYLTKLDIPLPIFGIRWLRLLFGREFPLQDLLVLWDAIFAEGDDFQLINFIVVSMLIRIRDKLLSNDYTTCLTYLMKYPNTVDVSLVIKHALHMKSPQKYARPNNAYNYVSIRPKPSIPVSSKTVNEKSSAMSEIKYLTLPSHIKNTQVPNLSPSTSKITESNRPRTNSLPKSVLLEQKKVNRTGKLIVDGMLDNDSEILKLELQDAYYLMTVTRLKLKQYVRVLRTHIPGDSIGELHQTLNGIEELCSLLKLRDHLQLSSVPIDKALEADEQQNSPLQVKPGTSSTSRRVIPPQTLSLKSNLNRHDSRTNYEIPDDNEKISKAVSKILADQMELEMHVIKKRNKYENHNMNSSIPFPDTNPLNRRNSE